MASMAMTEQTPKMMPSMVSTDRSLCSIRLLTPSRTVLMNWKLSGFMRGTRRLAVRRCGVGRG